MPSPEDVRFAAQLVHHGALAKEDLLACLQVLESREKAGEPVSLDSVLVERGLLSADELIELRKHGGKEVPRIPGFEIESLIGTGGTSDVYRARRKADGASVALKVLFDELQTNASIARAFVQEARLLIELRHENIVEGYKVQKGNGHVFLEMELIDGESLVDRLRRGESFDEDTALFVVLQAARALDYLMSRGIVHRDVKPGNILLTGDRRVKLIDLGFAKVLSGDDDGSDETTVGTVQYISPEQARGRADVDVRSDIYSLGATLYQLVVGKLPFEGDSNQDVLAKQILQSLSSPDLKRRNISPHMHYFIEKMMAKERDIRYQDPKELIQDIESQMQGRKSLEIEEQPQEEAPSPTESSSGLRSRRRLRDRRRRR
ncbi:MAG: serine/threonine-protein kinase [Planctomycetota bacterium]